MISVDERRRAQRERLLEIELLRKEALASRRSEMAVLESG
jgi:hypothetical protein